MYIENCISMDVWYNFRRLYVKKCGQLYEEKVNVEMDRVKRVQSAKEVMQVRYQYLLLIIFTKWTLNKVNVICIYECCY